MLYKIKVLCDMIAGGYGKNSYYYKKDGIEFETRNKQTAKKLCDQLNKRETNSMYKNYYKLIKKG